MRDGGRAARRRGRPRRRASSSATTTTSETTTLAEYWTLGRAGDRWILLSIEQDAEGAHHLDAPIVASPWSDDARLHDEAVTELAVADATPDAAIGELVDVDYAGDGRAQALDLSVVDGRFAPAVLEAAARRAVEAWAEAVDGADDALERAATPEAAHALLYPRGESTRLVVRGPRLQALRIVALDAGAADLHRRGRAQRPPLPRGPRHRRGARGLEGPRHHVHRALDARARRRPGDAVADRRDRRGGLATLLLAVPNVSEGRDRATLDAIGAAFVSRRRAPARRPHRPRPPPQRLHARRRAGPAARGAAGGRARGGRADRPDRARGRAPARGRARRRPDRPPHRRRARRGDRRGAAARPPARPRPRPARLSVRRARGRARAREPARARRARPASRPTTARRGCTRPRARRSSPPARRSSRSTSSSRRRPLEDAQADRGADPRGRRGGAAGRPRARPPARATSSRSRPTSRTTRARRRRTSWPPSRATRRSRGAELVGLAPAAALEGLDVPLRNRRTLEDHIDS